jgi:hypothetical protein
MRKYQNILNKTDLISSRKILSLFKMPMLLHNTLAKETYLADGLTLSHDAQ